MASCSTTFRNFRRSRCSAQSGGSMRAIDGYVSVTAAGALVRRDPARKLTPVNYSEGTL